MKHLSYTFSLCYVLDFVWVSWVLSIKEIFDGFAFPQRRGVGLDRIFNQLARAVE